MIDSTEITNISVYLAKVMGFDPLAAEIFAKLYVLSTHYKINLTVLLPVLEGLVTLEENGENGQVVVNTGIDVKHNRERYFNVILKRVLAKRLTGDDSLLDEAE